MDKEIIKIMIKMLRKESYNRQGLPDSGKIKNSNNNK